MVDLVRIGRHLATSPWRVRRAFPRAALLAIERAIGQGELAHDAEIRFAVEGALGGARLLRGQSAAERALELFSLLRMWDTERRNGVLIYVLLADRAIEVVADRGARAAIDAATWEGICRGMQAAFAAGRYGDGAVQGIHELSRHLGVHFPARAGGGELSNQPIVL
jgi:uncharacterized membrane protein